MSGRRHGHCPDGRPSPTWNSWAAMKARCTNQNHHKYPQYGGRGIRICDAWMEFPNFLRDMGERPAGTSLDRVDNNGPYCPGNCRWATASQQMRNRRCAALNPKPRARGYKINMPVAARAFAAAQCREFSRLRTAGLLPPTMTAEQRSERARGQRRVGGKFAADGGPL